MKKNLNDLYDKLSSNYLFFPSAFSILEITGLDSFDFLNGLLSNDLTLLEDSAGQQNAILNEKGQIMYVFFLFRVFRLCL